MVGWPEAPFGMASGRLDHPGPTNGLTGRGCGISVTGAGDTGPTVRASLTSGPAPPVIRRALASSRRTSRKQTWGRCLSTIPAAARTGVELAIFLTPLGRATTRQRRRVQGSRSATLRARVHVRRLARPSCDSALLRAGGEDGVTALGSVRDLRTLLDDPSGGLAPRRLCPLGHSSWSFPAPSGVVGSTVRAVAGSDPWFATFLAGSFLPPGASATAWPDVEG